MDHLHFMANPIWMDVLFLHAIGLKMGPKDKTLVSSETTSEDKKGGESFRNM